MKFPSGLQTTSHLSKAITARDHRLTIPAIKTEKNEGEVRRGQKGNLKQRCVKMCLKVSSLELHLPSVNSCLGRDGGLKGQD